MKAIPFLILIITLHFFPCVPGQGLNIINGNETTTTHLVGYNQEGLQEIFDKLLVKGRWSIPAEDSNYGYEYGHRNSTYNTLFRPPPTNNGNNADKATQINVSVKRLHFAPEIGYPAFTLALSWNDSRLAFKKPGADYDRNYVTSNMIRNLKHWNIWTPNIRLEGVHPHHHFDDSVRYITDEDRRSFTAITTNGEVYAEWIIRERLQILKRSDGLITYKFRFVDKFHFDEDIKFKWLPVKGESKVTEDEGGSFTTDFSISSSPCEIVEDYGPIGMKKRPCLEVTIGMKVINNSPSPIQTLSPQYFFTTTTPSSPHIHPTVVTG